MNEFTPTHRQGKRRHQTPPPMNPSEHNISHLLSHLSIVNINIKNKAIVQSRGWLGSRVVSVLDSGAEGSRAQIAVATLSGNSLRQAVHTHCASVHQAAKLVAAPLRVAGVNAGLVERNGSLPPGL